MTFLRNQWYTIYPLHLNYITTLPCKTITTKFIIFNTVLVLKSNENMGIWHFRLSELANSSKPCENSLSEDLHKVSTPSFHKNLKSFDKAQYGLVNGVLWQIILYCLQDFLQLADGIHAISQFLLTQCPDAHFIVHGNFSHDSSNQLTSAT